MLYILLYIIYTLSNTMLYKTQTMLIYRQPNLLWRLIIATRIWLELALSQSSSRAGSTTCGIIRSTQVNPGTSHLRTPFIQFWSYPESGNRLGSGHPILIISPAGPVICEILLRKHATTPGKLHFSPLSTRSERHPESGRALESGSGWSAWRKGYQMPAKRPSVSPVGPAYWSQKW